MPVLHPKLMFQKAIPDTILSLKLSGWGQSLQLHQTNGYRSKLIQQPDER